MALETVFFPQDPFCYGGKNYYSWGCDYLQENNDFSLISNNNIITKSPSGDLNKSCSSSGVIIQNMNDPWSEAIHYSGTGYKPAAQEVCPAAEQPVTARGRKRRQRTRSYKNKEDIENQRMTHIAVERNRRKQMNEYLAVIKSVMPASYVQRGDQASIIGGAINFVKELEQQLQILEATRKNIQQHSKNGSNNVSPLFSNFFTFPQYSMHSCSTESRTLSENDHPAEPKIVSVNAALGDIEVTIAESHANLKILTKKRPKQLLKIVAGLQRLWLTILHVNLTTLDQMVLYTVSIKIEEGSQLNTVRDIADEVNHILANIEAAV